MLTRLLSLLLLIAGLLSAQIPPQLQVQMPPPGKPGSVTFTFLNSVTQQPVPGVSVRLFAIGPSLLPSGVSDANGRVMLNGIPPGSHGFTINPPTGFTAPPATGELISVKEGEAVTVPPISVIPPGAIEGIVRDVDGNPVVGATVEVVSGNYMEQLEVSTNESGHYRFAMVRPGGVLLRVSMPTATDAKKKRFPTTYYPDVIDPKQALRLQVSAGRDTERADIRVRLTDGFHVRGTLALAAPAQGLQTLFIRPCDATISGKITPIGEDGSFDFDDVPPGTHCVRYQELLLDQKNKIAALATARVTVIDRDVDHVQLVAGVPTSISGMIQLDEGAKMPVSFSLNGTSLGVPTPSTTLNPDTGRFTVEGILPGNYALSLNGAAGYTKSMRLGTREVDPNGFDYFGEADLTIRVAPTRSSIHGKVLVADGKKAAGIVVTVALSDGNRSYRMLGGSAVSDQREFTVGPLPPGEYKVYAWEAYQSGLELMPAFRDRFKSTSVSVKDQQQAEVEVRLITAAEIEQVKATF